MDTDFLLDLDKLMCKEEGEKKYLLPVFVPAQFELSSNIKLLYNPYRQTKVQTTSYSIEISSKYIYLLDMNSCDIKHKIERNRPNILYS
jgi:hypothetical protein